MSIHKEPSAPEESRRVEVDDWYVRGEGEERRELRYLREVLQARTMIIAAKAAYHYKSPRWLTLFTNAMAAIERCPLELRERLKNELTVFHPHLSRRPRMS